jgi:hypothetical protein
MNRNRRIGFGWTAGGWLAAAVIVIAPTVTWVASGQADQASIQRNPCSRSSIRPASSDLLDPRPGREAIPSSEPGDERTRLCDVPPGVHELDTRARRGAAVQIDRRARSALPDQ